MADLDDKSRQLIRQCADLFFSEHGTVQENVYRVAAAAFRAGMATNGVTRPAIQPECTQVMPDSSSANGATSGGTR